MSDSLETLAKIHYGKSPNEVVSIDGYIPIVGTGGIYGCADQSMLERGIVVPRKRALGTPYLFKTPFWPVDTTYAVIPRDGIDLDWLYYCLLNFDLTKLNEATGVPSINRNWLAKTSFTNPGAANQARIAAILTATDTIIEKTKAMAANGSPVPRFETDDDRLACVIRLPAHPLAKRPTDQVTGEVGRLLRVIAVEMSRLQIQVALALKHEDHFRNAYLILALAADMLEMTQPDKPRSSKQRYRLTAKGRQWLQAHTEGGQG